MKPIRFAIAVALYNSTDKSQILAVQRPANDDNLPNAWGLPAIMVKEGELPEDAVRRLGIEKLSTKIKPISYIGILHGEREDHELILMDIKAELEGEEPSVHKAPTTGVKYVDQQWTNDLSVFKEAARKGSLCSRIILTSQGMSWD